MFNLISNEKEKMKVINYYHFSTALQMCAVIGTVAVSYTHLTLTTNREV